MKPLLVDGRPHWETSFPREVWPVFEDFRNFLIVTWNHLGLPYPTEAQFEIAHRLQYGVDTSQAIDQELLDGPRTDIIRAYRGVGKSYITATFVVWRLLRNPRDEKVLIVSATGNKSKAFVSQLKSILLTLDLCTWLLEGPREKGVARRDQADRFDVAMSSLAQSPSIRAAAIGGQVTGDRATLIVADDVEIEQNSKTEEARLKIVNTCREFDSIGKTEWGRGDIIYLGTPQTEESIYNILVVEQSFNCFTIPVRYPAEDKLKNYRLQRQGGVTQDILAPYLVAQAASGQLRSGSLTDPKRFTTEELLKLESKGRAYFALQMMLDTSLSDAERYPLRQHDLIVFSLNDKKAPMTIQWGLHNDRRNVLQDVSNVGFSGDYLVRPLFIELEEWKPYEGSVLFVDTAGRGKDEMAWAIIKSLNGMLFCLHVNGHRGDPAVAMEMIARDAKLYGVNVVEFEPNFGQGMAVMAFGPVLQKIWPGGCTVQESEWAKGQKEVRIIDTLEPVLTQHRLVISEDVVRKDLKRIEDTEEDRSYSLLWQLTHISKERGSVPHDDRLDALAGAVAHFQRAIEVDVDQAKKAVREAEMDAEIADFMEMNHTGFRFRDRGRGRRIGSDLSDEGYERYEVTKFSM